MPAIEDALTTAAQATGATVLFRHSHLFDDGGCSGVVVLAESHASYHYWWQDRYMALDVFVCGACDPSLAVPVLREAFAPEEISTRLQIRGEFITALAPQESSKAPEYAGSADGDALSSPTRL